MADAAEYARLMEPIARRLLGEPRTTHRGGREWRYGNHEAFKVDLDLGVFHDYDHEEKGGVLKLVKLKLGLLDEASAAKWLEEQGYLRPEPRLSGNSRIEHVYQYHDQDGTLLFEVVRRYENGERRFSQRAPDPGSPDGWRRDEKGRLTVKGVKQVPYRLAELLRAVAEGKMVVFVEGEKDADRLWSLGLPATTNAMGASNHKWLPEFAPYFAEADLLIIPDYDLKGQQHGERIAKIAHETAKRVRLLNWESVWPEIRVKNDVSDWLDNGGGDADALRAIADQLPTWTKPQTRAKVIDFPAGARLAWFDQLRRTPQGRVITDLRNVMIALCADPGLIPCFAYNEMLQAPMLTQSPPLLPGAALGDPVPRQVTEEDISGLQEWLQHHGLNGVGRETVAQALEHRAFQRRFHPLREWLDGLEPTSQSELDSWLQRYFGCQDDEYHRQIGRMFIIAMVARIYEPGCQADYMLVLEGPQGEVKSQACRTLAGDGNFSDHLPDIDADPVRLSMGLRGKWLIEISELSSFSKAGAASLKSFITRQVEIYIPKYGRMERREPRQCLFVGTTNDDTYLKDETGGRRFWPAKCGGIDKDGLEQAREQLFAHAVDRYRHGEQWWPERGFEKAIIAPQQTARLYQDAWLANVREWLDKQTAKSFTLVEIAQGAIPGFKAAQFGIGDQRRLGAVLRLCDWKCKHSSSGNTWEPEPGNEA